MERQVMKMQCKNCGGSDFSSNSAEFQVIERVGTGVWLARMPVYCDHCHEKVYTSYFTLNGLIMTEEIPEEVKTEVKEVKVVPKPKAKAKARKQNRKGGK